jgi:hypothetical protein
MRKIFSSPRLENVERVAALLMEHGVEARISNGRSYKGRGRSHFTYRDHARSEPEPTVWIVKPDDQPKARELMRAAGLLDSGRSPTGYLSTAALHGPGDGDPANRRVLMAKLALLIGIVLAVGIGLLSWRRPASTTAPAAVQPVSPTPAVEPLPPPTISDSFGAAYRADMPSALATMLLQAELRAHETSEVCLSVDGAVVPERMLAQLEAADRARVRSQTECATADAKVVSVAVREYRTDGSGIGTVQVEIIDSGKDGKPRVETRTLEVKRSELQWEVKRVVLPQ